MKVFFKRLGVILGVLISILTVFLIGVIVVSNARINKTYEVETAALTIPTDAESIAAGQHMSVVRGCIDCHGENLSGAVFMDDPAMGTLIAPNLTGGQGGVENYSDSDWDKAIRYGVGPDGKPLLFMPSHEFYVLSDNDLAELIAYFRSLDPVDNPLPDSKVGLMSRVLFLAGQFPLLPAELIDHDAAQSTLTEAEVSIAYGEYLATGCVGCHGNDYSGGPIVGMPPDTPPAANLTPGGPLGQWSEAEFKDVLRTGVRPDGSIVDPVMPISAVGKMTDDELSALLLYFQSLPAK